MPAATRPKKQNPLDMIAGRQASPAAMNPQTGMFNPIQSGMSARDVLQQREAAIRATMPQPQQQTPSPLAMVAGNAYSPSPGAIGRQAQQDQAMGSSPWQPLVGQGLSGNLNDAQMASMYPQGQINNPQAHPLYASPWSGTQVTVEPSTASAGLVTDAGRMAARSLSLRNDPEYQRAVANNRQATSGGVSPVRLDTGPANERYKDLSMDSMAGGWQRQESRRDAQIESGLLPQNMRQSLVTARAQGRPISTAQAQFEMQDPSMAAMYDRDPQAVSAMRAAESARLGQSEAANFGMQGQQAIARAQEQAALAEASGTRDAARFNSGAAMMGSILGGQTQRDISRMEQDTQRQRGPLEAFGYGMQGAAAGGVAVDPLQVAAAAQQVAGGPSGPRVAPAAPGAGATFAGLPPLQAAQAQSFVTSGNMVGLKNFLLTSGGMDEMQVTDILRRLTGRRGANVRSPQGQWFEGLKGTMANIGLIGSDWVDQ